MSWYAVYRIADGQLLSVGEVVANPLPDGLASIQIDEPNFITHEWDSASLTFVQRPQATTRVWSRYAFMMRIPTPKRIGIRAAAKSDPVVEDFVALLDAVSEVHSDDPGTVAGLDYLVSIGLLEATEKEVILNG